MMRLPMLTPQPDGTLRFSAEAFVFDCDGGIDHRHDVLDDGGLLLHRKPPGDQILRLSDELRLECERMRRSGGLRQLLHRQRQDAVQAQNGHVGLVQIEFWKIVFAWARRRLGGAAELSTTDQGIPPVKRKRRAA